MISLFKLVLVYQKVYFALKPVKPVKIENYLPAVKWQTEQQDQTHSRLLETAVLPHETSQYML